MIIQQCGEDTCHQTGSLGHSWNPMILSSPPLPLHILRTKRDKSLRESCKPGPFGLQRKSSFLGLVETWSVI